jgi:hypothetical protein
MRTMLVILALLAAGTAANAGSPSPVSYDYPWCVMGGELGYSGGCSIRPEPNAWRRHPGDGTCIAMSTGASFSSGSRPWSSRCASGAPPELLNPPVVPTRGCASANTPAQGGNGLRIWELWNRVYSSGHTFRSALSVPRPRLW